MLSTLLQFLAELCFPTQCVGCGQSGTYCCRTCLNKLPPARSPTDRNLLALFDYHDSRVKKLIWRLKYRGAREIAKIFATVLYERVLDEIVEIEMFRPALDNAWLVIPIPLTKTKRRRRGFNQTEEIAKHFLRHNTRNFEPAFDVLVRPQAGPSQMSIKERAARWLNVANAFRVAEPERVKGRDVLLIDDVTTTGATISEARRILHEAGARSILPAAIAHG